MKLEIKQQIFEILKKGELMTFEYNPLNLSFGGSENIKVFQIPDDIESKMINYIYNTEWYSLHMLGGEWVVYDNVSSGVDNDINFPFDNNRILALAKACVYVYKMEREYENNNR